jgi:hypothetical protein
VTSAVDDDDVKSNGILCGSNTRTTSEQRSIDAEEDNANTLIRWRHRFGEPTIDRRRSIVPALCVLAHSYPMPRCSLSLHLCLDATSTPSTTPATSQPTLQNHCIHLHIVVAPHELLRNSNILPDHVFCSNLEPELYIHNHTRRTPSVAATTLLQLTSLSKSLRLANLYLRVLGRQASPETAPPS